MDSKKVSVAMFALAVAVIIGAIVIRSARQNPGAPGGPGSPMSFGVEADAIVQSRGLSPEEVEAALKTYPRPGKHDDEFVAFLSGGHSGSVVAVGLPSCRILKVIPVYAQDSWQGWLTGSKESEEIVKEGFFFKDMPLTWGDLHHPKISLTNGSYDGRYLACADKAGPPTSSATTGTTGRPTASTSSRPRSSRRPSPTAPTPTSTSTRRSTAARSPSTRSTTPWAGSASTTPGSSSSPPTSRT